MDLQELLALGTVAVTALLFLFRALRRQHTRRSCGGSCDCTTGLQLHGQSNILNNIAQKMDRTEWQTNRKQ